MGFVAGRTKAIYLTSFSTEGFRDREVNNTFGVAGLSIVEGLDAVVGAIHELVENDNVSGVGVLLKAATGVGCQHVGASSFLQSPNVGTEIDFAWHYTVLTTMSERKDFQLLGFEINK